MLILDNCNVGIPPSGDTLSAVIDAWTIALQFMESVVSGQPMAVQSGEVLLAMSSWHLYPDLEVLGNNPISVKQKDPLVAPGGIVTIGLENPNVEGQFGVSWSLPLSHLRYYGKSVLSTSSVNYSGSRVPMGHLVTVALGSAIGSWARTSEDVDVFAGILQILKKSLEDQGASVPKWLLLLHTASNAYRETSGDSRSEFERLFEFGRRRAANFLSDKGFAKTGSVPPWLDLSNPVVITEALGEPEAKVRFLRELYERKWAKELGDSSNLEFAIIRYKRFHDAIPTLPGRLRLTRNGSAGLDHSITSHLDHPDCRSSNLQLEDWEYASLAPIYVGANGSPSHRRWIPGHMPERYGPNRYVPISTSAAIRFRDLSQQPDYESITILPETHPRPMNWLHAETQPSETPLRGWDIEGHPNTAINSRSLDSQSRANQQHYPNSCHSQFGLFEGSLTFPWPGRWTTGAKNALSKEVRRIEAVLQEAKSEDPNLLDVVFSTPTSRNSRSFLERSLQRSFDLRQSRIASVAGGTDGVQGQKKATWSCYSPTDPVPESSADCLNSWYVSAPLSKPKEHTVYSAISQFPEHLGEGDVALVLNYELVHKTNHHGDMIPALSPREVLDSLSLLRTAEALNTPKLLKLILEHRLEWMDSLEALWDASELYQGLPGALVELSVSKARICRYDWSRADVSGPPGEKSLAWELACIATFETGYLNIDPATMVNVMGVSTGSSLYMSRALSLDPGSASVSQTGPVLGRCVGNIGKPGLAFLISVDKPDMKDPGYDRWNFVQHTPFEGNLEDNFSQTSLHLSFTGYKQPLFTGVHGLRDTEVYFLQSVVQVYDKGSWIADIDIVRAFASNITNADAGGGTLTRIKRLAGPDCAHSGAGVDNPSTLGTIKSIDCWDELIDEPDGISIARAKGNRLARLALSVVAFQKKKQVIIADTSICWDCVRAVGLRDDAIIIC